MSYKRLFVLCEGDDDERFFAHVLEPRLRERYDHVRYYQYAQKQVKEVQKFVRSIEQIDRNPNLSADYLILRDFDQGASIAARKGEVRNKCGKQISPRRIVLVVQLIEGWYAAGLDANSAAELGADELSNTDNLLKPHFDAWIPERFSSSRIDFMQEILKRFDVGTARRKSGSFDHFCTTHL